jgi:hypothetical protein
MFDDAAQRTARERQAFLDQACADDAELRREVESLLGAHDRATDFLETPAFEASPHLLAGTPDDSLEGRTIGPYIVRQLIGRGGMGVVYLADDTRLSRRVALKAFASELGDTGRERLRREARAAAALSHPGIATVYALEEIENHLYMVSEYVPGPTLRAMLKSAPLPPDQILDIATQLGRGLAAAHAQGVVHRDLKPENAIRTAAGAVKILDFGIARSDSLTAGSEVEGSAGTPGYMAPEQIRGEHVDFHADLFAFGVLVSELLTGVHPFAGPTRDEMTRRILDDDPAPLAPALPPAYEGLRKVIEICLRKQPAARYDSTFRLVSDLERLQQTLAVGAGVRNENTSAARNEGPPGVGGWWGVHQIVVSAVYALMIYPAWRVRPVLAPWGTPFLLTLLTCATAAATLRLHLLFVRRFHDPSGLAAQQKRTQSWIRWCDAGVAGILLVGGIAIAETNSAMAMLFVTVAIAAGLASFVIEPATIRAAFESKVE